MRKRKSTAFLLLLIYCFAAAFTQSIPVKDVKIIPLADRRSSKSVNAVIFSRNSLVTYQDVQCAAFYDPEQYLVLAKRKQG